MKISDFFKNFQKGPSSKSNVGQDNYQPSFWEDDYCQVEIVPRDNKDYITGTIKQIDELSNKSKTEFGFTDTFARGQMPKTTLSEEFRADYLESLLKGFEFEKAKKINYNNSKVIDCETGSTKAYGFSSFTIFFDTQDEFVKNIWLSTSLITSDKEYNLIKSALYSLGEECEMVLVDWNSSELFDLGNRNHIDNYLRDYWK